MYNSKAILAVAALAGTSSAQFSTRLTSGATQDPTCAESLASFSDAPTPDAALVSYLEAVVTGPITAPGESTPLPDFTLEDPDGYQAFFCSLAGELPSSLLPDYAEYAQALVSYGREHIDQYYAYVTDCITTGEAAATITSQLSTMLLGTGNPCESTTATATPTGGASNGTYPTGTGSYTAQPTGTGSPIPTAAAVRPTGVVAGAAALGGLLGVVAML
ncbi:hypothetical protein NPX13_g359 [Xylaria arbuscula]|uniref:Infection structure specific protein n=1 Tax=Xylaria arbuscula TaxID=114810 RepID=A0A9W8NPE9_9PEZI|nr:hypothetical protein NPX13_g359 [Xylaria arbuscula]